MLAMVIAYMVIWLTPDPSGSSAGDRLSSITSETSERGASFRTDIWSSSLGLIWNRPWFEYEDLSINYLRPLVGYGPELFKYVFPWKTPEGGLLSQAHNFILHHWVEQGILGLLSSLGIFVAFFLAGLIQLWRNRESYSTTHKLILVTLLATIAGRMAEMMVGVPGSLTWSYSGLYWPFRSAAIGYGPVRPDIQGCIGARRRRCQQAGTTQGKETVPWVRQGWEEHSYHQPP